ncbi:hypothetical protein SAMN04487897_11590 [Paenibacillus sp. yr247]|uniref:hypothetical protein n=1 Tax=Paenibacillus sp. yr247 TaxID=1761880 RepID=UPI00089014CE|nr:hypothetical protein [Paenibacillus sp. yr247]SDO50286.1 hypothetical protein SAMN04487897_11590 [Paenibacillus sp. yr247]
MSFIEFVVEDTFKITGRGYVLCGVINEPSAKIKIGDTLRNKINKTQEIKIKSIEMINYGINFKDRRQDIIGLFVDITDEEASEIKGKTFIKMSQ